VILGTPSGRTAVLGATLVVAAVTGLAVSGTPLRRDRDFTVSTPRDGAAIGSDALFTWAPTRGATTYAVVVDAGLPAQGQVVSPSERVMTVSGTSVRLTLGRARTGSPSSRGFHTVTVLPLDEQGRRLGRDAAVVHVRNAS
jgi:hypothetical protein